MEELELPFPRLQVDLSELSWEQMALEELSLVPMELLPEQGLGDLPADQLFGLVSTTGTRLLDQMEDHPKLDDTDLDEWLKGVSNPSPLPETNILQVDETSHGQPISPWRMGGWKTGSRKSRKKRISPWNLVRFGGLSLARVRRKYTTRKNNSRWIQKEVESLVNGISEYGVGRWTEVKRKYFSPSIRTAVNLKDKWRNLLKAYYVNYKSKKKGKVQKKTQLHLEQPLIERIRELADKHLPGDDGTLSDISTITG